MSQNKSDNATANTSDKGGSTGGGAGTTGGVTGPYSGGAGSTSSAVAVPSRGGEGGTGTATATDKAGITAMAKEYGQTVADAATQAKDYISDKASVVGDKFQDLRNKDYSQIADEAKDYARQNPGQALVVAAAAGFVIGLLVRGGRR